MTPSACPPSTTTLCFICTTIVQIKCWTDTYTDPLLVFSKQWTWFEETPTFYAFWMKVAKTLDMGFKTTMFNTMNPPQTKLGVYFLVHSGTIAGNFSSFSLQCTHKCLDSQSWNDCQAGSGETINDPISADSILMTIKFNDISRTLVWKTRLAFLL